MENLPRTSEPRGKFWIQALVLAVAVVWIYWPALHGTWLWDDNLDLAGNRDIRAANGLGRIWLAPSSLDYFPLTATVRWFQWRLWHDQTLGYHLTTLGLHLAACFLLWRVLARLGLRHAWIGGLLFAVHPLCVESVAWIAELKNTLSLCFLLLSLSAYLRWDAAPSPPSAYVRALFCFLLSLLAKTAVVLFPMALLLHAWWRRGRVARRDILASLPFFALSLALGLVTLSYQKQRAIGGGFLPDGTPSVRLAVSGLSAIFGLAKGIWPARLLAIYPRWNFIPPRSIQLLPWTVLAAFLFWLVRVERPWSRTTLFGLSWFWIMLIPVAGFFPMSYQSYSWTADHFVYFSLAGLAGLAAAAIEGIPERRRWLAVAGLTFGLAVASHGYARNFADGIALWSQALRGNPGSGAVHDNLGTALAAEGRRTEALAEYEEALRLKESPRSEFNLATTLEQMGRSPEAIPHFLEAIQLRPKYPEALANLGGALMELGRYREAVSVLEQSLGLDPDDAAIQGKLRVAREALRSEGGGPGKTDAFETEYNLGTMLARIGRYEEAGRHMQEAMRIRPGVAVAHLNYGNILYLQGKMAEAAGQYRMAIRLDPRNEGAKKNLEMAEAALNR